MIGNLHPLTLFTHQVTDILSKMGFSVIDGNEIETEWYNFDFLRVPSDHPARDVQDTFWLDKERLLRTHTTTVQGHSTKEYELIPPMRVLSIGRVFRNEATDGSHEAVFYQMDGFVIDQNIHMGHLIGLLTKLLKTIFGEDIKIRLRPHHYPFVEPGLDIDMYWKNKWLEVLGSGMIHPEVLANMGIDSTVYSGFAFGMGIDRLMMLKYGLNDIRASYTNDFRLLKQFKLYETND